MTQETKKPRMALNRTVGDFPLLDAVDPIEALKLLGELGSLVKDYDRLKVSDNVNDKLMMITVTSRVRDILTALGYAAQADAAEAVAAELEPDGEVSASPDDELSDDPNSPNYRYADTGYIADSRKELAANSINTARKTGERVRTNTIDWAAIEQNPRQAADLITKANLFGKTDWDRLQAIGMSPAAGFLISKVYGSIGPAPAKDGAIGRKDYAFGLETIRDRLEGLMAVDEVLAVLAEIKDELTGVTLNSDEADQMQALRAEYNALRIQSKTLGESSNDIYAKAQEARSMAYGLESEIDKRKRRGWAVDPAKQKAADEAKTYSDGVWDQFATMRGEINPKVKELDAQATDIYKQMQTLSSMARMRNISESPVTRAWLTFGERFFKLLHYRSYRGGSDSFAGHVTNAKAGKIKDWSWADPERAASQPREATKGEVQFQMKVADKYERKGGRQIEVNSTQALKEMLGFRDVQSGNWVLKDPNSAKFHVEQTAAAMSDLSDIVGIDMKALGLGGRLGMAFGARGTGGKNAARAHYEPVLRVINLTKLGGGGALTHEYFHSLDNMLHELVNEQAAAKKTDFVSTSPELLPEGPIRDAVKSLRNAMLSGSVRSSEVFKFNEKDVANAKYNFDRQHRGRVAQGVVSAGNATDAMLFIDSIMPPTDNKRAAKQRNQWRKLVAAWYAPPGSDSLTLRTGPLVSAFFAGSMVLDNGERGKYWSQTEEMFARAFQSYCEDKLASMDRRNDYLSAMADNKFYEDGLFGPLKPFPEGEERTRINAAFDQFFAAIRDEKVFEKVMSNPKLLDSIFGLVSGGGEDSDVDASSIELVGAQS